SYFRLYAMGSWFSRRKPVSEELESLSAQMKEFRRDIEIMNRTRRNALWYLSLLIFVVSSSSVGYLIATIADRTQQVIYSSCSLVGGIVVIIFTRRLINIFFDFRVRRKHAYLDELITKKKKLLDNVKETETFKVAKEILAKYDEDFVDESKLQRDPRTMQRGQMPMPQQRPQSIQPVQTQQQHRPHMTPPQQVRKRMVAGLPPQHQQQLPQQGPSNLPPGEAIPFPMAMHVQDRPHSIKPIRPFAQEAKSGMEKVVDYFFGDGPNSRLALICNQCHCHNGMAFPGEFEYLAYICYMCGHFNPARKMRNASGPGSISGLSTPMISRQPSTRSLLTMRMDEESVKEEKEDEVEKETSETEKKDEEHNTSSENDTDQEKL
ncbi:hypothetical protein PFISCL1PPCAC_28234, partial [Pristionchus fissidentatus]